MTASISCQPIGLIHSRFKSMEGTPIQSAAAPDEPGQIEIFGAYAAGLADIEGFEFLMVLTHFHLVTQERLEVVPFLDTRTHGIFATRAPVRPNRIGVSVVRLMQRDGSILYFTGCDMLDQTPVLDVKPSLPEFDCRSTKRIGWFEQRIAALPNATADDRMR